MSGFHDNVLLGASGSQGYQISRSVRLRSSASASFSRTPASSGSLTTWTWSAWVKRGALGSNNALFGVSNNSDKIWFSSDQLSFYIGAGAAYTWWSAALFRDPSAWYHIVVVLDTTNATSTDRVRVFVNGVRATAGGSTTYPTLNYSGCNFNTAVSTNIGRGDNTNNFYYDGYLTEVNFIDGQALTPASFGETNAVTGVWQPKKYTGTYGTNGFYLNFSDNSAATAAAIGKDYSGNGNNWTPNNISVTAGVTYDSMLDVPTQWADGGNGRGNYATWNPITVGTATVTNGNLTSAGAASTGNLSSILIPTSGKWYAEFTWSGSGTGTPDIGIFSADVAVTATSARCEYRSDGSKVVDATVTGGYGSTYTNGDVIAVAVDVDSNTVTFYKNNVSQGAITYTSSSGRYGFNVIAPNSNWILNANFGQRPFAYTPPSGFKALNTLNLPTPTILKGNQYFDVSLYTGNATARSITGVGFQPDFVWAKSRSGAESHRLYDAVRGATQSLYSNLTNAETTEAQSLTAFNSDGFSLGTGAPNSNAVTYAAWQWKAGGTAVSNTAGSITSSVSANTTSGFSVVTYTGNGTAGATIGHGLGVAPSMMIAKNRSSGGSASYEWTVYHASLGATKAVFLNDTGAAATDAGYWYNTAPTSTLITVPSNSRTNVNGSNFVIYCFAEVPGFSKFGSYTGNGSADGPFVFCGFRPRFVMIKRTDAVSNWWIENTANIGYNTTASLLSPNTSDAEYGSASYFDLLSNGFKLRQDNTTGYANASGGTYIFAAFAENPFKNALAR